MISKREALDLLHAAIPQVGSLGLETLPLAEALGRVLAEDVAADMDMPPFDRSAMDGFAARSGDFQNGLAELLVCGTVAAGEAASIAVPPGSCVKIMTGAPVPADTDVVVMVEKSEELPGDRARVRLRDAIRPGQNIAPRGQDMRKGEFVLTSGTAIRPIEVGMLATLGCAEVAVFRRPRVAVIATGDELVALGDGRPGPGQIRESNGHMLSSQVADLGAGIEPIHLGIARDNPAAVNAMLDTAFAADVVVLSGGVSMGEFDYVHHTLKERGLNVLFEQVAMKPGKPLLFGEMTVEDRTVFVFGLPGNPVSSYVTFELFVRPFLRGLMGFSGPHFLEMAARITSDSGGKALRRTQHLPAKIWLEEGEVLAEAVTWNGSGDLRGLLRANGFIIVEAHEAPPKSGTRAAVLIGESSTLRPPHSSTRDY
ncbi:MAG: gephyrin-like molybdotransferase Glp [Planctomycetota bacterium]